MLVILSCYPLHSPEKISKSSIFNWCTDTKVVSHWENFNVGVSACEAITKQDVVTG